MAVVVAQVASSALQLGLPAIAPALRDTFDTSPFELSLMLGVAPAGLALSVLGWGMLADRLGARLILAAGMVMASLAITGSSRGTAIWPVLACTLLAGIGSAPAHAAGGKALIARFPRDQHGLVLGIRHTAIPMGSAAGAVVLAWCARHGGVDTAFMALAIGFLIAAVVVQFTLDDEPLPDVDVPRGASAIRSSSLWLLGIGGGLLVLVQWGIAAYLVLYLHDVHHWSAARAASTLAIVMVAGGMSRIVLGTLSDRLRSRVPLLQAAGVLSALSLTGAALTDHSLGIAFVLVACVLASCWNGVAYAVAADLAPIGRDGAALGLQTTLLAVAAFCAPLLMGALVHAHSWHFAFAGLAVLGVISAVMLRPVR
jgi:sugar phosphate permease